MAVWKLQRLGRVSAASGEAFPPDTEIVTALFGDEDEVGEDKVRGTGFIRRDFLPDEASEERLAGAFCTWHTRTPPADPKAERRFDLGMAKEFLQRLLAEGEPERAPVCLTLALLLARKRRVTIMEQDAETLTCRWPGEQATFKVPAPVISDAEAETLQQDVMRLFGFEQPESPEPSTSAAGEASGAGASSDDGDDPQAGAEAESVAPSAEDA